MQFLYDGKKLTVSGRGLTVATANGETVITEATAAAAPAAGGSAPATGAKRGRKSNAEKEAAAGGGTGGEQTAFNPAEL